LNPHTGAVEKLLAGQGYSEGSSWSRGQSWILYGFALTYRYTGDQKYLETAKRTANYFIVNATANGYVPLCDFRQPERPEYVDTSAGMCAVCGLLELAEHASKEEGKLYRFYAEAMLRVLTERYCDWDTAKDGIVQRGKVAYNDGEEGTDLIYADYFLSEAVLKLMKKGFQIW
jgi:unsaturated chondroitin disaccharide hydrolase